MPSEPCQQQSQSPGTQEVQIKIPVTPPFWGSHLYATSKNQGLEEQKRPRGKSLATCEIKELSALSRLQAELHFGPDVV